VSQPRGLLRDWSWEVLARLYAAGDGGLVIYPSGTNRHPLPYWEGTRGWSAIARLRNRTVPYVEEFKVDGESCVRLTSAGRGHVEANRDRYITAYPDVWIPGPYSGEARHRADTAQLRADIEHRRQITAFVNEAVEAHIAGSQADAAQIRARAAALRQAPECWHWPVTDHPDLGPIAFGANCTAATIRG
jgi:hypothetical protein